MLCKFSIEKKKIKFFIKRKKKIIWVVLTKRAKRKINV